MLMNFVWNVYDNYGDGDFDDYFLAYFAGHIGFHRKLLTNVDALEKIMEGKSLGRCVVMIDALEQFVCSPLYNVVQSNRFAGLDAIAEDRSFKEENEDGKSAPGMHRVWVYKRNAPL
ncbi:hypothetical protein KSP39_PZI008166 [Platanthera zijinensis]|uniref:Uncharacterized protein n=1 Tax=Platanthera zijinensis TaxID=2320716 RepID=A0AAP0G8C4_9ASPA